MLLLTTTITIYVATVKRGIFLYHKYTNILKTYKCNRILDSKYSYKNSWAKMSINRNWAI